MNPQTPPAMAPATIIAGITTIGVPAGRIGARTIALAPQAPSRNWPSAPMFQRRIRKASAHARPVRMSGVAATSVRQDAHVAEGGIEDVQVRLAPDRPRRRRGSPR